MSPSDKSSVCAILAAAGIGSRLAEKSNGKPKQFLQLAGRPLYQWSLLELCRHPDVGCTVVMTLEEMVPVIQSDIKALGIADKVIVTRGGDTRQASVRLGLEQLSRLDPKPDVVLVHDAARPFLTAVMIDETISSVRKFGACTTAIPASDTIKKIDGELVSETLDREELVIVQTPQAARFDWLLAAHEKGMTLSLVATDDAALLEAAGYPVAVVPGSKLNLKVTGPEDLILSEAIAAIVLKK